MIIECPCKKKKFNIDINLIPAEGRNLQCGACDRVWFYKQEDTIQDLPPINEEITIEEKDSNEVNNNISENIERTQLLKDINKEKSKLSENEETKNEPKVAKKNQSNKFLSYLIVFIISLGALIILLDTLKTPLINIFPGLEILLFNLYETLKDIKLFIIDLS